MADRPLIKPYPVFDPGNDDLSTPLISNVTIIQQMPMISYSLAWSGSVTGSFAVEVSNDYLLSSDGRTVVNPGTWTPLPLSVGTVVTSGIPVVLTDTGGFIDIDELAAYAIRLSWLPTSGGGTIAGIVAGKVT